MTCPICLEEMIQATKCVLPSTHNEPFHIKVMECKCGYVDGSHFIKENQKESKLSLTLHGSRTEREKMIDEATKLIHEKQKDGWLIADKYRLDPLEFSKDKTTMVRVRPNGDRTELTIVDTKGRQSRALLDKHQVSQLIQNVAM